MIKLVTKLFFYVAFSALIIGCAKFNPSNFQKRKYLKLKDFDEVLNKTSVKKISSKKLNHSITYDTVLAQSIISNSLDLSNHEMIGNDGYLKHEPEIEFDSKINTQKNKTFKFDYAENKNREPDNLKAFNQRSALAIGFFILGLISFLFAFTFIGFAGIVLATVFIFLSWLFSLLAVLKGIKVSPENQKSMTYKIQMAIVLYGSIAILILFLALVLIIGALILGI